MTIDLDDHGHDLVDPELDARLTAAFHHIAADYRPSDAPHPLVAPMPRRAWVAGVAAVAAVALGIVGVATMTGRRAAPPSASSSVPSTVSASDAEPVWGDGFVVPEIAAPRWAVSFDSSLGLGDFELVNRYASWLFTVEPDVSRWFVHLTTMPPYVAAAISLSDFPSYVGLADELILDVERPREETWDDGSRTRVLRISGGPDEAIVDDIRSAMEASEPLHEIPVPDGYEEISYQPFDAWQVPASAGGERGWGDGAGWGAGVILPTDATADLALATAALEPGAQRIAGGWAVPGEAGWELWFRDQTGQRVVSVRAPSDLSSEQVRGFHSLVTVGRASDYAEQPLVAVRSYARYDPQGLIEQQTPVTGGTLAVWGRWLALDAATANTPDDVHCLAFVGALAGIDGCTAPGSTVFSACGWVGDSSRLVMVTTSDPASLGDTVAFEVGAHVYEADVVTDGGLTIATVELDARPLDASGTVSAGNSMVCAWEPAA